MTLVELAKLVKQQRDAQKAYFNPKTRTIEQLEISKALERQVDRAVADILDGPTFSFGEARRP